MARRWPGFRVPARRRPRESKASAYTISSCDVHNRVGEPSAAIRYTSDPPLAPPPGNGNGPVVCGAVGPGVMVKPGAGVVVAVAGAFGPMFIRAELKDPAPLLRFSPTAAA